MHFMHVHGITAAYKHTSAIAEEEEEYDEAKLKYGVSTPMCNFYLITWSSISGDFCV